MNYLLGAENSGSNVMSLIVLGILLVLLVVYFILVNRSNKKRRQEAEKFLSEMKVGSKVVTNAGIYGEVVSQRETNMGRVVVLKTGGDEDPKKASYITVNASVILGIDEKQDLVLDENGDVVDSEKDAEKLKAEILEEKAKSEDGKVANSAEDKKEEKPAKSRKKIYSDRNKKED